MPDRLTILLCLLPLAVTLAAEETDDRAVQESPLDRLDPAEIPLHERFDWQGSGLVALLGSHHGRHWGGICSVAISPDGERVATGGSDLGDRVVRLWDARTLRLEAVLRGHGSAIWAVAFRPGSSVLASGSEDRTLRLWDAGSRPRLLQTLDEHQHTVSSVAFSTDGKWMASGDTGGRVLLWDFRTGRPKRQAILPPQIVHSGYKSQAIAFSPDGKLLATSNLLNVVLWDLATRPPSAVRTLEPKIGKLARDLDDFPGVVQSLAWTPDGKTLAAGHYNSSGTRLWNLAGELKRESLWLDSGTTASLAISPDGSVLATNGSRGLHLWDLGNGATLRARAGKNGRVAFAPDGATLVSSVNGRVGLFDLSTRQPRDRLPIEAHAGAVGKVALSPGGDLLASSYGGSMRLWRLGESQPRERTTLTADSLGSVSALAFAPRAGTLVSGHSRGDLRVWDARSAPPRLLKQMEPNANAGGEIWKLVISPDGRLAATGGRNTEIRVWDLASDGPSHYVALKGAKRYVLALAFSPDGKTLASGSDRLRLWSLADPRSPTLQFEVNVDEMGDRHTNAVQAVAFAPRGETLVSGSGDGVVRFWSLGAGTAHQLSTLRLEKGPVSSIDYSPDGSRLVVAYRNGSIILADAVGNRLRDWQLDGPTVVRFALDGRHLLTENSNSTSYILRCEGENQ